MSFLSKKWYRRAGRVLKDPQNLHKLVETAGKKAQDQGKKASSAWADLKALIQMVRAYGRGEYRALPAKSLFSAVLALVYFVNPFDLLPDVLLFGFVDDFMVLGYVMASIKADLENFKLHSRAGGSE